MKRIIFGTIIILFGLTVFTGIAYYMFLADKYPVSDIWARFTKTSEEKPAPSDSPEPTPTTPVVSEPNIPTQETDTRRIVVVDNGLNQPTPPSAQEFNKDDLVRMAGSFAERFGSFSNQSNYSNILNLKIFMSEQMKIWSDSYVAQQRAKQNIDDIYYGITTRAIYKELIDYDEDVGRARVRVSTRRREATISTGNVSNVFNQDIEIKFIKEKGIWKVDSAYWQKQ